MEGRRDVEVQVVHVRRWNAVTLIFSLILAAAAFGIIPTCPSPHAIPGLQPHIPPSATAKLRFKAPERAQRQVTTHASVRVRAEVRILRLGRGALMVDGANCDVVKHAEGRNG